MGNLMGLTLILLFIVLTLLVITTVLVINGVKAKNWKKVIISVGLFLAIVLCMYFGLIRFITSM